MSQFEKKRNNDIFTKSSKILPRGQTFCPVSNTERKVFIGQHRKSMGVSNSAERHTSVKFVRSERAGSKLDHYDLFESVQC